jgi:hypothetical protein
VENVDGSVPLFISLTDALIALTLTNEHLLKLAAHFVPFVLRANHLAVVYSAKANQKSLSY